jgi:MoxR-like ATPase
MESSVNIDFKRLEKLINEVIDEIETVIIGKRDTIRLALTAVMSDGHILIEDVPGVGKTMLAKSLARVLGCSFKRIQFTPDLLPADITGVSIFNQKTAEFEFRPGPIFAQFVLADEINRSTPKTQSSLLECMEERQVTVDGVTYVLPTPFVVIATENNIEYHGTYPLPEAQLDRFMMKLSMGYPKKEEESSILNTHANKHPFENLRTILSSEELLNLRSLLQKVYMKPILSDYIVAITSATRTHPLLSLGASPRGSLHLARASRALAAISGRDYVLPDDIKKLAVPVLAHRLILSSEGRMKNISTKDIVEEIISSIPVPY